MKHKDKVIKITILSLIVLTIAYFLYKFNIFRKFNMQAAKDYINSYGNFAALIYILIFSLRTLLVIFPFSVMVVLGGSIFGHVRAFIFSMISIFITASLAFFISRFAGKDFLQKLLRGKLKQLDLKIEKHGFKIIFLMRISTIFPYDILNFAAGLSKVKYKDFILGTLLGIIPETFSLTYLGSNLSNPFSPKFIFAIILVVLTMAIPFTIKKVKNKNLK